MSESLSAKKKGFHALSVGLFLSLVSLFLGLLLDNYGIYSQYKTGIRFGVSLFHIWSLNNILR